MNLRVVVCSIAEIEKVVLDEGFAFLHQGNGDLAVAKGCCAQNTTFICFRMQIFPIYKTSIS